MQTVVACMSEHWGYGKPVKTLSLHELSRSLFWFYLAQVAYKGTIWPAKLSILILYNRVFGDTTQQVTSFGIRLRTSLIVLMSTGISFFFISEIVTICTCVPVQRYWDKSVRGKCEINTLGWWFAQSAINTISDIVILCLPMPLIKDLQIPRRQKIGLILVFALGLFVTVCTIVRMTTFKTGARGTDTTYDGAITLIWSLIETNVAIICACLPLLRPLIARLVPGFNKTKSRSKDKPDSYNLRDRYANSKAKNGSVRDKLRKESWGWKDATTITSTNITNHRTNSDESQIGLSKDPFGRGITKQTDFEITTETASDQGSERNLTAGTSIGNTFTADLERNHPSTSSL